MAGEKIKCVKSSTFRDRGSSWHGFPLNKIKKFSLFLALVCVGVWIFGLLEYSQASDRKHPVLIKELDTPQQSMGRKRIPPIGRRLDKTRSNSDSNNELWAWVFGSLLDEQFESLTKTKDGGCIFIGTSFFQDLWFVKLFSDGEVSLLKLFKGPGADFGNYGTDLNPIIQTQDEGFAFVFSHLPTRTDPVIASGIDIGFVKASPEMDYVSAQYALGKKGIAENRADYEKLKDLGYAVAEAGDGDFFVLGLNYFQDSSGDLVVFKISTSENRILWKKLLRIDGADDPAGVVATEDGGCYVFGNTSSFNDPHGDAWVVKFSSTGECLWQRAFGGAGSDRVYSALLTSEEGLILAGATSSFGNVDSDFWLFAISPAGDIKPGRQIAIGGNQNETAYSLDKAMNGDILLGGSTDSSGNGNQDCLVIRVSPVLKVMWAKTFGGKDNDYAKSVQEAADGNLYVAGPTRSFGYTGWWYEFEHKEDVFVLKLSSNGETNVPDLSHEMNVMVTNTYASSSDTWAYLMESDLDFLDASGSFSDFEANPFPVNVSTLFPPANVNVQSVEKDKTLFKINYYFILRWEKNYLNKNLDVVKYHIYVKDPGENMYTYVGEVLSEDAITNSNYYRYEGVHQKSEGGTEYFVTAIDSSGRESAFSDVAKYFPGRK